MATNNEEIKIDEVLENVNAETAVETEVKEASTRKRRNKTEEEKINSSVAFFAHPVSLASKEVRADLRSGEHVVTEIGDETPFVNENTIREDEYKELAGSASSGRILEGTIIGVRHSNPDDIESTLLADVLFRTGAIQVTIPSYVLFDYKEEEFVGERGARRLEDYAMARINSKVHFIVRNVDEGMGIAIADALEAQNMRGYINYIRKNENGRTRVNEGDLVQAKVIAVGLSFIIVDVLGAETLIRYDELSYMYLGDVRTEFNVGDTVIVRVLKIEVEETKKRANTYRLVKIEASVRQARPDMRKHFYEQYKLNGIYSAKITFIDEAGHVFCDLQGQIDCMCKYPTYGVKPYIGQTKTIRITEKNEEKLHLYGTFVS